MSQRYFVTGIGTEVGKTIVSAILTEALEADYWKPIQAGDLDNSDTHKIGRLLTNKKTKFHPNAYALKTPMSPHGAAQIDGVHISSKDMKVPETGNDLVIEGAGGLLVPISDTETIADLIRPEYKVILVSRHYLGSINHTLLSIEALKARGLTCEGIIFSGDENPSTEDIIKKMSGVPALLRLDEEKEFNREVVSKYASRLREVLMKK